MIRKRTRVAASLLAISSVALTSCAAADTPEGTGALQVVATTTQVADFVREVGGDQIELTTLLSPGASAHAFEPTPADMAKLSTADVLVINGLGLETFVDNAIDTSGFAGVIVDASTGIIWEESAESTPEDHAAEAEAEAEAEADAHAEDADSHAHDEHAHDEHAHGGENPHIWTSPVMAAQMVAAISEGLIAAKPDSAAAFEANATAYDERLLVLDEWVAENFAQVPESERLFVSGHNSLDYYLQRYGIEFIGSILPSFEDNAEPSVAEIDALVTAIRDSGAQAIFVESTLSPKIADRIAQDSGATLVSESVIYADSLGAAGTDADSYIAATIHNTRTILEAWGYTPLPVPSILET